MRYTVKDLGWLAVVLLALWGSAACRGGRAPTARLSHRAAEPSVAALVQRADEAFATFQKPDYGRPLVQGPDISRRVGSLYWEACRAGDKRSCWLADVLAHSEQTEVAVRGNCLAGDLMNCRALELYATSELDKRLRGWAGRTRVCRTPECREATRSECADGFPVSCWNLSQDGEPKALERATHLALEGCRAGLLVECRLLQRTGSITASLFAHERLCTLALEQCRSFSEYDYPDHPEGIRDALERGCQFGTGEEREFSCGMVVYSGYLEGKYPEPVPGRALALGEWYCRLKEPDPTLCLHSLRERIRRGVVNQPVNP